MITNFNGNIAATVIIIVKYCATENTADREKWKGITAVAAVLGLASPVYNRSNEEDQYCATNIAGDDVMEAHYDSSRRTNKQHGMFL